MAAFTKRGDVVPKGSIRNMMPAVPSPNGLANQHPDSRGPRNTGMPNKYPGSGRGMPVPLMPGG